MLDRRRRADFQILAATIAAAFLSFGTPAGVLWNASNIYSPTLVIGGNYDTWSYLKDREGLMRDLVHAPVKKNVVIPDATHFVLFENKRFEFFDQVLKFLRD
jgi:pimeloyl-ACP methyl ester carboxylesterase